jgi:hypothetical protein
VNRTPITKKRKNQEDKWEDYTAGYVYEIELRGKPIRIQTWLQTEKQGGNEIIEHQSCVDIGEALDFRMIEDQLLISPTENNHMLVAFHMVYEDPERKRRTVQVHEASNDNTTGVSGNYRVCMAWKRTQDACILELARPYLREAGLPRKLYSDIQFGGGDEETETVKDSSPPPSSAADDDMTVGFGKYKGKRLSEIVKIDRQYVEWLATNAKAEAMQVAAIRILAKGS